MKKEDVYKAFYDPKYYMELVKYIKNNKDLVNAALRNENVEHFRVGKKSKLSKLKSKATDGDEDSVDVDPTAAAGIILLFFFILLFASIIWLWALIALIKYWNQLPTTIQAIGVISLITGLGGPIVTLILVYIFKGKGDGVNPVAKISSFI